MIIFPIDQLSGQIWLNGKFVTAKDAKIHLLTHSLHYSGAVFEGIRSYNGKIFKLKEHIERLFASAEMMRLAVPYTIETICQATEELLKLENGSDSYIRPLIWRGSESMNIYHPGLSINVLVSCWPFVQKPAFTAKPTNNETRAVLSEWRRADPIALPNNCKSSAHYAMMSVALIDALNQGFADALLLDMQGNIAEFTTSNVFFVAGKELITPTKEAILPGITRQTVMDLALELGLTVTERNIKPEELDNFSECFATGTAAEIKRVAAIQVKDQCIEFSENIITEQIQQQYKHIVSL